MNSRLAQLSIPARPLIITSLARPSKHKIDHFLKSLSRFRFQEPSSVNSSIMGWDLSTKHIQVLLREASTSNPSEKPALCQGCGRTRRPLPATAALDLTGDLIEAACCEFGCSGSMSNARLAPAGPISRGTHHLDFLDIASDFRLSLGTSVKDPQLGGLLTACPPLASTTVTAKNMVSASMPKITPGTFSRAIPTDILLDQYYTRPDIARTLYQEFLKHCDDTQYLVVEPSAGKGAFLEQMPAGALGFDLDPKHPKIIHADFLTAKIFTGREIAVVGNPPFGRAASMAVRFFNHAATMASVIAFILPRSCRKASVQNRLNENFHLVHEVEVPGNAFLFRDKKYDVPAIFQIWQRGTSPRPLVKVETRHPDFKFTTPDLASFAIQRVGARAGRIHLDFTKSRSSHYFIAGQVANKMLALEPYFVRAAGNAGGNPSLSKAEIVSLYRSIFKPR